MQHIVIIPTLDPIQNNSAGNGGDSNTIRASCPSGLITGDVVYISGPKIGLFYTVNKVNIDSSNFTEAIGVGVIESKESSTECTIRLWGLLEGIYTGMTGGKRLYIDTNGRLQEGPPPGLVGPGTRMIQRMGYVLSSTCLMFDPEEPIRSQK